MDVYDNVASFECALLVYVCGNTNTSGSDNYNAMSRARTKLVIIDIDEDNRPPLLNDDVIICKWKGDENGTFQEL